ncbi:MAG: hypothetical protein ACYCVD_19095 [Desulfitobacteriaceae bacterium]
MLRWTEEPLGEAIVDAVLSLNNLVEKRYGQEVATASYSHVGPTLKTIDQIAEKLGEIDKGIADLGGHPGDYLRAMTKAFRYFARSLQGDDVPYPELLNGIQELPADLIPEEKGNLWREEVIRQLTDLGYKGTTQEKITRWLEDTRIPPELVTTVSERFIKLSKEGTLRRVTELPPGDGIDSVNSIRGVFWSGYSKYQGNFRGKITFNIDRPWTEPILAHVMTHEGYSGHQAFYCLWDYLYQQGKLPLEASYYLINSPTNALFEGGPEVSLHFLGWDSEDVEGISPEQRVQYKIAKKFQDLQRIAMTNACYQVNLGLVNKEEALEYMKRVGYVNGIEAENAYRFFTDPIQRTYYPVYYHGRWIVGKSYDLVEIQKRSDYFKILYHTPHTTRTFIKAIRQLTGSDFDPFVD